MTGAARRVIVGLSGGVDSAVAALCLRRAGHDVQAVFMKNWEEDDTAEHCSAAEDLADAERVCERLGIRLRAVSFAAEYWDRVFTRFLAECAAGRTPNPDVWCNREIKFRELHDFAADLGAGVVATGHYARVERRRGRYALLKGRDRDKDQSYFLYMLNQAQLARARFPLGDRTKPEVRRIARAAGLANHARPGSTGICFIGERPFKRFLQQYLEPRPGPIESVEGRRLGVHEGLPFYTIGQRQGLGVGGRADGDGRPWYVAGKDAARNALLLAQGRDHPALRCRELELGELHWVSGAAPPGRLRCAAKTRYRQPDQPCEVSAGANGRARVRFEHPQWGVACGQSVVFYQGEECLGGGIIETTSRAG